MSEAGDLARGLPCPPSLPPSAQRSHFRYLCALAAFNSQARSPSQRSWQSLVTPTGAGPAGQSLKGKEVRRTQAFDATPSSLARSRPGHVQVTARSCSSRSRLCPRPGSSTLVLRAEHLCVAPQSRPCLRLTRGFPPPACSHPPLSPVYPSVCPSVLCSLSGRGAALPGPRASQPLPPQASAFAGSLRPFAPPGCSRLLAFSSASPSREVCPGQRVRCASWPRTQHPSRHRRVLSTALITREDLPAFPCLSLRVSLPPLLACGHPQGRAA